jgi:hypothetical protein
VYQEFGGESHSVTLFGASSAADIIPHPLSTSNKTRSPFPSPHHSQSVELQKLVAFGYPLSGYSFQDGQSEHSGKSLASDPEPPRTPSFHRLISQHPSQHHHDFTSRVFVRATHLKLSLSPPNQVVRQRCRPHYPVDLPHFSLVEIHPRPSYKVVISIKRL